MMLFLDNLVKATRALVAGRSTVTIFTDLAYDSRLVEPGQLFVALVTDTGDGHTYISQALQAGATGVLCQRLPEILVDGIPYLVVADSQQALIDYAGYILAAQKVEVIGITGSLGKTSTKEAIAAVLARRGPVFKSYANYNGRLGLAITMGKLEPAQHLAVLEMACDGVDEIRDLAAITRPHLGVVSGVSHSHLQYFGTLERIALEKGRLVEALPASGIAILNGDDNLVRAMRERTCARVYTYGLKPNNDYYGSDVAVDAAGTSLSVHSDDGTFRLHIPLIGAHHAYTILAAAAVGRVYGLEWEQICAGLGDVIPLAGRTRLLAGYNGSIILDDSYNANPTSTLAALKTLSTLPAQRRLVLLGDMAELGDYAKEAHRQVGKAISNDADFLVTKGEYSRLAAQEALANGLHPDRVHITFTSQDAVRIFQSQLRPGDLLLIKGSAQARLEFVTRELLADRSLAPSVLSRQNLGWQQVRLQRPDRPTWVEIDLEAVAHNVRRLVEIAGPEVEVMAVLKADGYGHGAIKVARTALNNGAHWLGVACLGEALILRQSGIAAPILVLGYTPAWQAREAVLYDVTVTLFALDTAQALARAAASLGRLASCHIKVDTGMGRLGLMPAEVVSFTQELRNLPLLRVDGIFTHLASADEPDFSYARYQLSLFDGVLAELRQVDQVPRYIHAANSAALLRLPQSRYNLVRPGIALYGINPSGAAPCPDDFRPALSFKCQIAQIKELPPGSAVSYGCTFITQRLSRIAVIPVGYADGFRRAPRNWGYVLVSGQRAPIVGRVCMDQTMIDVTDIPSARQGDEVVLIGNQGNEHLTVDQVAEQLGTINYEVVSEILARVPRLT
ncbi:MAG: alanine racemase [Anaerolineae bacterium]